jgi:amino acid adenylation domain-containing protein/non-ribosomal peptide synthase protein (TIGR01720 family)
LTQTEEIRGFRLSPQQRRLWTLGEADGGLAYRAVLLARMGAEVPAAALAAALERAVARHEVLRTVFRCPQDVRLPVQVVLDAAAPPLADAGAADEETLGRLFETALRSPFAPGSGPLVRAVRLAAPGAAETWLLLAASALCLDSAGLRLLAREVAGELAGILPGEEPLQYPDLAEWQNAALEGEDGAAGRDVWTRRQEAISREARLPWTRPPAPGAAFEPVVLDLRLPPELAAALTRWAEEMGQSLVALLLATWASLLGRSTGEPRVTVGTVLDGRHYEELAEALGTFERTLPLVLPVPGEARLEEAVAAAADELHQASTWQECFAWEQVAGPPDPVLGPPFLPFGFAWHLGGFSSWIAGPRWEVVREAGCSDRFTVLLQGRAGTDGVTSLELCYDPDSLDAKSAAHLAERLRALLEDVARRGPSVRLSELNIVGKEERHLLLEELASGGPAVTAGVCVHRLFEEQARLRPEAVALVCGGRLTAGDLETRANRLAHHLRRLGVDAEVPVAICIDRIPAMVVGLLAVLKAGGCYVPIDPTQPAERLVFMLEDSGAPVLLTQSRLIEHLPPHTAVTLALDTDAHAWAGESAAPLADGPAPGNAAYAIYTSGSTGAPKRVVVEHRQLEAYVSGVLRRLDLPEGASFATVSTFAADLGHTAIFPALASGGALHVIGQDEAADPERLADRFAAEPVDCLKIVPSHLRALLRGSRPEDLLPRRRLVLGGEAADRDLLDELNDLSLRTAPELEIFNHYGPTETTVGALAGRLDWDLPEGASAPPLGRPLPGVRVYLLDGELRLAPAGVPGEVFLGGSGVSRGYGGRPDLTAERFVPDLFGGPGERLYRTGDLARWLPGGDLEFLGRIDQQVKIHGYRVEPGEVEAVLSSHPAVAQAAVVARPDTGGPRLVAYLVPGRLEPVPAGELRDFLRHHLPEPMIPSAWVWLPALPLTRNGKLDRQALPAPERAGAGYVAPRNREEEILARIWQEVLGVERVGVHDNFFELGGDSILSIQIIARAVRFGLSFTPKQVFQYQTVAELVALAGRAGEGGAVDAEQGEVAGEVPLTPVQHRFFAAPPDDLAYYNQALLLEPAPSLGEAALRGALAWLPRQHDALRLRFLRDASIRGGWRQEHAPLDGGGGDVDFHRVDLSALPEPALLPVLEAATGEAQRGLDLGQGPIWRAVLFELGGALGRRLLLLAHHLVVDGVSWRVLQQDLEAACASLQRGELPRLPAKTTSYKTWAERLLGHAQAAETLAELGFWTRSAAAAPVRLPVETTEEGGLARTVTVALEEATTLALVREVPACLHAQAGEILLSALTRTIMLWAGSGVLAVDLEGHGREDLFPDVDLSRTVGWLTSIYPVHLEVAAGDGPCEALAAVQEQLRKVPQRGISYGVLRYLSPEGEAALAGLPATCVSFNYLGQMDAGRDDETSSLLRRAFEPLGPVRAPRGRQPYLLEIVAGVGGGRLWVSWTYGERRLRRSTVEALAESFHERLRELVAAARSPRPAVPTDFPLAGLDRDQLEKILLQVSRSQETA